MTDLRLKHTAALVLLFVALGRVSAVRAQSPVAAANDFQIGDRIVLRVDVEPQLTDTFTVRPGPEVVLPIVGNVSLAGFRRDQIEKVLADAVAKYYRNAVVHARTLVHIAVLGEVARPGFYFVPAETLVPDVLMAAGGPLPTAQINAMHIDRNGTLWLRADSAKKSIAGGLTLSQLRVRSEDQFVVPRAPDSERTIRLVAEVLAIPIAIITVLILTRH